MTPDEVARLFDRSNGRQVVILDGLPVALNRTNYDSDPAFTAFLSEQDQ